MASKREDQPTRDPIAALEARIAALKTKIREGAGKAEGAARRALRKKLRRAQRRRRSLMALKKSTGARHAGRKTAAAAPAAPAAPSAPTP